MPLVARLRCLGARALRTCGLFALVYAVAAPPAQANQLDPARLDSTGRKVAELVEHQAAAKATFAEQLAVVELAIAANALPEKFGLVCELISVAHDLARSSPTRTESLDDYRAMVESFDFERFTAQQRTHLAYVLARFDALDGVINQAEAALLEVLARDSSELSLYTATSAHYMAAYCSYYTDQLDRCAYHARKSARGFFEMGDMVGALEGYDGTSTTYFKMGKLDSALYYGRKGLALVPFVDAEKPFNLYLNYAEALMATGQPDSAYHYAHLANAKASATGRHSALARSQFALANLYRNDGRPREAAEHYERSADYFAIGHERYHLVDVLDSLSGLYAERGDYRRAYESGLRGFELRDSLREDRVQKDNDRIVAEAERDALSKQLEASAKERALAQAVLAKNKTERIAWVAVCGMLFVVGAFLYYRTKTRKALNEELQRQVAAQTADLRAHSDQLEQQAARLRESNAELERFAYIASHDLKTPLRNVTSFLGLIGRRLPVESRALVAEYLDIALDNARQMHDLVTDVLEFSRLNSNISELSEQVAVAAVVDDVRTSMRAELAERNAVISCVGDVRLVLPKGSLEQVLANLIGNGLKYNKSARPEAKVIAVDMGDRVRISVQDNGIGIEPEYHDRIFEVFRRLHTSDEFTGTGVGLAACRKVALRLGGDITVESAAGVGSTFTVELPKDARVGVEAEAPAAVATAAQ